MMIPDDVLRELIKELNYESMCTNSPIIKQMGSIVNDTLSALDELLTLRAEIARLKDEKRLLIENSERLANILSDGEGKQDKICCVDYYHARVAVYAHAELMPRVKG